MKQLDLFHELEKEELNDKVSDSANRLLDLLNQDAKKSEMYEAVNYYQYEDKIVLMVANKEKELLFNIIDRAGNVPAGFCVCWRNFEHIKQELKL